MLIKTIQLESKMYNTKLQKIIEILVDDTLYPEETEYQIFMALNKIDCGDLVLSTSSEEIAEKIKKSYYGLTIQEHDLCSAVLLILKSFEKFESLVKK